MRCLWIVLLCVTAAGPAQAGPLRDWVQSRREATGPAPAPATPSVDAQEFPPGDDALAMGGGAGRAMSCADWSRRVERLQQRGAGRHDGPQPSLPDLAYGDAPRQRLDVFRPTPVNDRAAPVLVMVHGGGWCVGDKAAASVTTHKVERWVPRGFVVVSVNYPMVNDGSDALAQARHIARAAAFVQARAAQWGGDPTRVILMGHSAGAHLVSLVGADASLRAEQGVRPLLAVVSLDAGAIDVVRQMPQVYPFLKMRYTEAFGTQEEGWRLASPFHRVGTGAPPWLGVCSTQRKDRPCDQAEAFAQRLRGLGIAAQVLPQDEGHGAINGKLGLPGPYTQQVEDFLSSLDGEVAQRLRAR